MSSALSNMAKRFAGHSASDILEKRLKTTPHNTQIANKKCANILRDYLNEKGQDSDFEQFDLAKLNSVLKFFYLDARKTNGDSYKSSSLENFRHGLNRYLNAPPYLRNIDIIKDRVFSEANESFKTAMKELKSSGKGDTEHFPEITPNDLQKMYSSMHMSTETPVGLYNKVQLDIRLYFCRRGSENMINMTKSTFVVERDDEGQKYVKKAIDELMKNKRENDQEHFSGFMPEQKSPDCPVKSFEKYLSKLHPDCDRLWQHSRTEFCDDDKTWFNCKPVGKHTLSSFMTNLSKGCSLSRIYTNHSIRATGITILARSGFHPAQIMAISGHKAVSSLAVYQRVSDREKFLMGNTISTSLQPGTSTGLPENPQPSRMLTSVQTRTSTLTSVEQQMDVDLLGDLLDSLMSDFDTLPDTSVNLPVTSHNGPLFQNCTIGTFQLVIKR